MTNVFFDGAIREIQLGENTALAFMAAAQASASATSAGSAAAAAQAGVDRYFATIAAGVSGTSVGGFFASAESGTTRIYLRTGTSPFYVDQGDGAAPSTQVNLTALESATAAQIAPLNSRPAYAHAQNFWRSIRAGQDDVYVFVNSDSTWNGNTEPFYRWADEVLGPAALTHTIVYRLWLDGSGWQTPVTLQTGTGPRTIYIDNAAIPGSGLVYIQGANETAIWADGRVYDLFIINHGHNLGFTTTQEANYPLMMISVASWMQRHAKADFFVTLQNPWLRNLAFSRSTQAGWRRIATELGLGIIDVASRFEALGDLNNPTIGGEGGTIDLAYYDQDGQGGLHPAVPAGVNVALPALTAALAEGPATGSTAMLRPLNAPTLNLMPNPAYTAWTGSAPDSHILSNVTAAKSAAFAERGLYGMALTCTAGANPRKTVDISSFLSLARGKWLSYIARVWVPAGMSNTAGRIQLSTTGESNRAFTSAPSSVGRGGWRWVMTCIPVLDSDISITATMLCGDAASADSGRTMYVDREAVFLGTIPGDLDESWMTGAFLPDLYNHRQTGTPTGFTGTLALSGAALNTMTVTGGTANLTRAFGNFSTIAGRTYRVSWGTRTVTGAAGCSISVRGLNGLGDIVATSGIVSSNGSLLFTATGTAHSFSINGGSNVTGFEFQAVSIVEVFSGIVPAMRGNLVQGRNSDFTPVTAAGGSGQWQITGTLGTSLFLASQTATGLTRTTTGSFEFTLPSNYIPGRDIVITVNSHHTGTGTPGTRTIDAQVYRIAADGTSGADLVTTAAQTITGAAADYAFVATGTSLAPGDRVQVVVVGVLQETGAVNPLTQRLNSLRIS